MNFDRPCEHCGGEIALGNFRPPTWVCSGCGCMWEMDMRHFFRGSDCPLRWPNWPLAAPSRQQGRENA